MPPSHYYQSDPRSKIDPRMEARGYRGELGRGESRNEAKGYHRNEMSSKMEPRYGDQSRGDYARPSQRNNGDYRK